MAMTMLGIDVSDKSRDELAHIVDVLKVSNLSTASINKVAKLPKEMRQGWIDNPDMAGELTDDGIQTLYDSMEKPFDEDRDMQAVCYSENVTNMIHTLDQKAYAKACGSFETSNDRQAAHYDFFHESFEKEMKKSNIMITDSALDAISEQVTMNTYDTLRNEYMQEQTPNVNHSIFTAETYAAITKPHSEEYINKATSVGRDTSANARAYAVMFPSNIEHASVVPGGKFLVRQSSVDKDFGTYLQSRTSDITDAVGERLGLSEDNTQSVFISNSFQMSQKGDMSKSQTAFAVLFNGVPLEESAEIIMEVTNEMRAIAPQEPIEITECKPILDTELASAKQQYANEVLGINLSGKSTNYQLPSISQDEINHAKEVLSTYDAAQEQYNADGFDATGHSADGDYNSMYDNAYNDSGLDI